MPKTIKLFSLVLLYVFSHLSIQAQSDESIREKNEDKKVVGIERAADKRFVQQDFVRAMEIYDKAFLYSLSNEYASVLHLKMARLYLNLMNYKDAIPHYHTTMTLYESLLTLPDVCNYLDALRYTGQRIKAMSIAQKYAYQDAYHSDQRFKNILHALDYQDGFFSIGTPEYTVRSVKGANTSKAEFFVGVKDGEFFYATSKSQFHDPNKRFYHRTTYHTLEEAEESNKNTSKKNILDMIPSSLRNGPITFSEDMKKIVVTQIAYEKGGAITMSDQGLSTFQTKLYYSEYSNKRKGWSSFKEAMPQQVGASYSHPYLFNNDKSILFSSDMPGGFGGYDIYIAHWNEKLGKWTNPINLGAQINTEGNEISPSLLDDKLIFASDGHSGFGGYDVYSISFEDDKAVLGTLFHFSHPINTVSNDFNMLHIDEDCGYIVSDRVTSGKDDIYYFERNQSSQRNRSRFGMSESRAISNGTINLVKLEEDFNVPKREPIPQKVFTEHILSIYFDFEQFEIRKDAIQELNTWFAEFNPNSVEKITLNGYADEMGESDYNYKLSKRRAQSVETWLLNKGLTLPIKAIGKGQSSEGRRVMSLEIPYLNKDIPNQRFSKSMKDKIEQNRKSRRVDIKVTIK